MATKISTPEGFIMFYNTHVSEGEKEREREREGERERERERESGRKRERERERATILCDFPLPLQTSGNPFQESQLFEILQFVEQTRGADPVVLVGDFNTTPHHLAYSLMTRCLRLHDIFTEKFCDSSYHKPRRAKEHTIDYIFISDEMSTSDTCSLSAQVHKLEYVNTVICIIFVHINFM